MALSVAPPLVEPRRATHALRVEPHRATHALRAVGALRTWVGALLVGLLAVVAALRVAVPERIAEQVASSISFLEKANPHVAAQVVVIAQVAAKGRANNLQVVAALCATITI